jgi:hypothetical protein
MLHKKLITAVALIALAITLGGCSKCGWIWEQGARPNSCLSDSPTR